jgi:predicted enzyme related to lactoylglutathione lyase
MECDGTRNAGHLFGAANTATGRQAGVMRIRLTSVFVDDQDKALKFYTEVLGFQKKQDFPVGKFKWLTVVSPEDPDGVQLLLEPDEHPATKTFKAALFAQGTPMATFFVDDIGREAERMKQVGVVFTMEPTQIGPATVAIFDDTCGNLIQLTQV